MAMSRTERFRLKAGIVDQMREDPDWDLARRNLLLSEFGFEALDGDWNGPSFEGTIAEIGDSELVEMYAIVRGVTADEVLDVVEATGEGNWKFGYIRLFISHSAAHREFVGAVSDELAVVGMHGFVAHDTMEYSKPWQAQIEQALRSMDAFVAIVHPEFNSSAWCHQEVGWALGRRVPRFAIRMGADPAGFMGHDQWPSGSGGDANRVASLITEWASSIPELGGPMVDGLITALEQVGNYVDAGAAAERIRALGNLNEADWSRLDSAIWSNDQVHGGVLPTRSLEPFYVEHGRTWPPPKPAEPSDPWGSVSTTYDEPPF